MTRNVELEKCGIRKMAYDAHNINNNKGVEQRVIMYMYWCKLGYREQDTFDKWMLNMVNHGWDAHAKKKKKKI